MNGRAGTAAGPQALRPPGLIVTADDFGLHPSVNAAVERAHRDGILTAASLMVGASAAADAIARAHALPGLRVGLHLVLADGPAVLPPRAIPDLVDGSGRFGTRMASAGMRFFCLPRVRRQLAREIRAQFDAFAASGLALDHVNAHKHFHLHPTILSLVIRIGREFGLRAVRLPRETGPPWQSGAWLRPWLALLEARLDAARIAHNDYVIGIRQSGRFDEPALLAALRGLPASGIGELYLHPALDSGAAIAPSMRGYRHAAEFAALVAPRVRATCDALRARGWRMGGFADLVPASGGTDAAPRAARATGPPAGTVGAHADGQDRGPP
jgi:hopanoid biosynthesis associated protein HpnK